MAIAPATNSVAYQSASRSPKNSGRPERSSPAEDISDATHGVQEFLFEWTIDLLAKPADEHIDDVGLRIEAVLPHVRQNHGFRDDSTGIAHEIFEQRELTRP